MNESNQGRTPTEVAANEEGFYLFIKVWAILLLLSASAYGGWQIGMWLLRELV